MSQWITNLSESEVTQDLAKGFPWLRFAAPIEAVYQQYLYQRLSKRARPVGWIGLMIILIYSVLDYFLFPSFVSQWTISIRLFFICPLILMVIWMSAHRINVRLFFIGYGLSYLLAGLAVVTIIMSARLQQVYMPYDGLLLLLMFGYFVMGVPFFQVVVASWVILLAYLGSSIYGGFVREEIIYNNFFLITANIIGGVGSYLQEHSQRTHFLGQLLLEFSHQKAEQDSQLKTKLLATASHELRQPLHAMNLLAENLSTRLDETEQQGIMGRLQLSIRQLQDLLGSLFEISRLNVGVIKPRKRQVASGPLIRLLVLEYQLLAQSKGIVLSISDTGAHRVFTDPVLLTRIVRNLLENAIKHSQATEVTVTLARQDDSIVITIADNGIGIAESSQSAAFREFNSLARHSGGLGVGLAIVKQLTALLNIELQLVSAAGSGCTFTLTLSASPQSDMTPQKQAVEDEFETHTRRGANRKQIMIVDDDPEVLASMTSLFSSWHYLVLAFPSPLAALNEATISVPDLIISDHDYTERGLNGLEFIEQVTKRVNAKVPALLLSANTELNLEERLGANTLVAYKPLKPAKLKLIIGHLLQRERSQNAKVTEY